MNFLPRRHEGQLRLRLRCPFRLRGESGASRLCGPSRPYGPSRPRRRNSRQHGCLGPKKRIMDDLKTILDRIKKPLTFAARDNFAHIKSLMAMEPLIHALVEKLRRVSDPIDGLLEIEKFFSGFDSLNLD